MILFCLALVVLGAVGQDQNIRPIVAGDPVKYPDNYCEDIQNNELFDFIVVGAGPAGCVVARRLAEIPSIKVLLIEAGGDPPPETDIPRNILQLGLNLRWNFTSKRSPYTCQGTIDGRCHYLPGKALGGSSVVNYMMYTRGNHRDYDEWAAMGNPGWSYKDVLPYFLKLENFESQEIGERVSYTTVSSKYHRRGGPLTSNYFPIDPKTNQARKAIIAAAADNGLQFNPDINGEDQRGITNLPGIVDSLGYRQNVAKAYLQNIPDNLKVCKNAIVNKVLFHKKTAVGVELTHPVSAQDPHFLRRFKIRASMEVILSAGPFNSPGILERSGIGQPSVLRRAGVPLLVNRPGVGENVQDHFGNVGNAFKINFQTQVAHNPLSIELTSLTAFINITDPSNLATDVQLSLDTYVPPNASSSPTSYQQQLATAHGQKDILFFEGVVLRQGKTGSIHITQSLDPTITPEIITNQLTTAYDAHLTITTTRLIRKIMSNEKLARFEPEPFVLKECSRFPFDSDEEIMCAAHNVATTFYHVVGACTMGDPTNPNSVVDSRLKVIGVDRLRVIDSSIMPKVTRSNTEIPTVMIGEKGADIVKEDLKWIGKAKASARKPPSRICWDGPR